MSREALDNFGFQGDLISGNLNKKPPARRSDIINRRHSFDSHVSAEDGLKDKLKSLSHNKTFLLLALSLSGMYFIITGVQFWCTDYIVIVMHMKVSSAYIYFTITCITAPVLGVFIGGVIIQAYGGYNTP